MVEWKKLDRSMRIYLDELPDDELEHDVEQATQYDLEVNEVEEKYKKIFEKKHDDEVNSAATKSDRVNVKLPNHHIQKFNCSHFMKHISQPSTPSAKLQPLRNSLI